VIPAAIGAGGAIALAVLYGYLSPNLPSSVTSITGASTILQAAGAIGLGFLAGKFMGRSKGAYVAMGGLTVVLVNAITPYISSATGGALPGMSGFGGLKLGGVGDYVPYKRMAGATGMSGGLVHTPRLGYINPASRLGAYMRAGARPPGLGAYMRPGARPPGLGIMNRGGFGTQGYTGLQEHDAMGM